MARFTATEAHDASKRGAPIMVNQATVTRLLRQHGAERAELEADEPSTMAEQVDAWLVLSWLGY